MAKTQKKAKNAEEKPFSLISDEKLLNIYAAMLKCRLLEQRATELFQHGKLDRDFHASSGREATSAAAVIDLEPADTLCLAPGDWLPAFVKGLTPETLFRVLAPTPSQVGEVVEIEAARKNILYGSPDDDFTDAVLDRASAAASARNNAVALAFIPSGSLAQWQNSIQVSATKKLPAIFVQYLEPSDTDSSSRPQNPAALVHGVPSIAVDALDPVAVYRVVYEAIVRARQLRGATLLQCILPSQPAEFEAGKAIRPEILHDPVVSMEHYLRGKGIEAEAHKPGILSAFNHDLDLAIRFLHR